MLTRAKGYGWVTVAVLMGALVAGSPPALASSRSQALYAKGLVPFHNGRWEDAYRLFNEAVEADGNDALAIYYRGLTAARRGDPKAAIPDLDRAARLRPRMAHVALDLGITYFDAGMYSEAVRVLEQAHGNVADRLAAAFFLGLTHYRLGDFGKAQSYLTEASTDPELRPSAQYYAGLIELREGRDAEGRAALEQVAQARADTEVARAARSYLSGVPEARPPALGAAGAAKAWSLYADTHFEYDSNVALAPSDSGIKRAEGVTQHEDGRSVLGFGGQYRLLDTETMAVTASYDFSQSLHFQISEFDLQGHQVRLEGVTSQGPLQFGMATAYDFYALNYQTFYQEALVTPWLAMWEGEAAATQVYYTFRGRDFFREPYDPPRDSTDDAFGIRQYGLLGSADRVLSVGYQFDTEDTVADLVEGGRNEFENNAHQFDVRVEFVLPDIATTELSYLFRYEDYQFPNSRSDAGFRRHDSEHQFVIGLVRDLNEYWQLSLFYIGDLNDSNIEEFDYDRSILSAGVRVRY